MIKTEVRLIDPRLKDLLTYGSDQAAGLDLRACSIKMIHTSTRWTLDGDTSSYVLHPGEKVFVGSGIALHLASTVQMFHTDSAAPVCNEDFSIAAILLPRSGLGTKLDIQLANTVGLIDADYQGEILMAVKNCGTEEFEIKALDRIVQMVVIPVIRPTYSVVEVFTDLTKRGEGGFGSTGNA